MPPIADSRLTEVHIGAQDEPEAMELAPDRPFRVLLTGDFSGRGWREGAPRSFVPRRIDRDNFDELLAGMKITLDLHGIALSFRELEDFHPDRIYQSAAIFQNLDQFLDRAQPAAAPPSAPPPAPVPSAVPAAGLLDQILTEHYPESSVRARDADDLASFIRKVTEGQLVPREDPAKQQREARRQELAAELLRRILRHPHMQAIEAAWRALSMLVRDLENDGDLQFYLLDITLPELIREMESVKEELRKRGPWAVIAGNYTFGQSELDAQALRRLAGMARALGCAFIGEARLSGSEESDRAWQELRRSNEARWLGLAMPRFLLRLPYGKAAGFVESFPFEEMPKSDHAAYLWGNPAFACAYLISKSFLAQGWELGRRLERRLEGLPMHVYREEGETVVKPCAEIQMSDREAENLLDEGFIPLVSMKDGPAALILRFQSIAQPLAALPGLA